MRARGQATRCLVAIILLGLLPDQGCESGGLLHAATQAGNSCLGCHGSVPRGRVPANHGSRARQNTSKTTGLPPQIKVLTATAREISGYAVDEASAGTALQVTLHRVTSGSAPEPVAVGQASLKGLDITDYPPGYLDHGFRFDLASIRLGAGDRVFVTTTGSGGVSSSESREIR